MILVINDILKIIALISLINPLTSPGEVVTVFTYPYLNAGAPALGEAKGLIKDFLFLSNSKKFYIA